MSKFDKIQNASCRKCILPDHERMVQCDQCDDWYHFECANVDEQIQDEPWKCPACVTLNITRSAKSKTVGPESNTIELIPENSKINSRTRISRSSRRNVELELKQLEEEFQLKQQFLKKKYELLNTFNGSERSSKTSIITEFSATRTQNWVKDQSTRVQATDKTKKNLIENPSKLKAVTENILSKSQVAARHVITKDLPTFYGNPQDWPLFISNYEESTKLCGFSNQENLVRLQKCLTGQALEAVRSMLMMSSSVPQVIEVLRMLFGKPEFIIHSLLTRIRNEPPPRVEKLETVIQFALSVKNLCATIIASGLKNHLCNPTLLQELESKLPPTIKLNWAYQKQAQVEIDLSHFGNWLFTLAQAASDVTIPTNFPPKFSKEKKTVLVHAEEVVQDKDEDITNITVQDRKCKLCKETIHGLENCKKFQNLIRQERWKFILENKMCRKCLEPHNHFKCKNFKQCGINGCSAKHHKMLHNYGKSENQTAGVKNSSVNTHQQPKQVLYFRVVPVILYGNNNKQVNTFAFLDEGSSITLLEEGLADQLELTGTPDPLCLKWTAETFRMEEDSTRIQLEISGRQQNSRRYRMKNARTVKTLNLPSQTLKFESLNEFEYLKKVPIYEYENAVPRILIGLDNWKLGIPLEVREGKWRQPVATNTRLGWVIHGFHEASSSESKELQQFHYHICDCNRNDQLLNETIKEFFTVESLGISSTICLDSTEDQRAKQIMLNTTVKTLDRFETGLLWKYDEVIFPDSYEMAKQRMLCMERRMNLNPIIQESVNKQIQEYVEKKYARKLTKTEIEKQD